VNELQHVIMTDVDGVLIGHQLFEPSEMFERRQLTNLLAQMSCDAVLSTPHMSIRRSAAATAFGAAIATAFEVEFTALTHDGHGTSALPVHRSAAAAGLPEFLIKTEKRFRQYDLTNASLERFDLLFNVNRRTRNLPIHRSDFPTINPYDNFYVHGVPSLGLRGSKPLVAGIFTHQGTPVSSYCNKTSLPADEPQRV
jgi:hypothetical protein